MIFTLQLVPGENANPMGRVTGRRPKILLPTPGGKDYTIPSPLCILKMTIKETIYGGLQVCLAVKFFLSWQR